MARREILVCDFGDTPCGQTATTWKIWRDGERQAWTLDLCEDHARPLLTLIEGAERTDLPARPRVRLEATRLRTTSKTRDLKK